MSIVTDTYAVAISNNLADNLGLMRPERNLSPELQQFFTAPNKIPNRCVASTWSDNHRYYYKLWVDGHCDCQYVEQPSMDGRLVLQHMPELCARPKGRTWIINDLLIGEQRIYAYTLLIGEKIAVKV